MDYTSKMLQVRSTAYSCDLTRTPLAGRRPGRRGPPEDPRAPAPGQACVRRRPVLPDHRGRLASSRCSYSRFGERLVHGAALFKFTLHTLRLARFQGIPRWKGAPRADCVPIAGRSLKIGILEHTKNNPTDRSRHTGAPGGRPSRQYWMAAGLRSSARGPRRPTTSGLASGREHRVLAQPRASTAVSHRGGGPRTAVSHLAAGTCPHPSSPPCDHRGAS